MDRTTPRRRWISWPTLAVSFGIAAGLVLVVAGLLAAETGRDALNLPDAVEGVSPGDGDNAVLRQTQIVADLQSGYEGVLILQGVELPVTRLDKLTTGGLQPEPGEQVELPPTAIFDPGNNVLSFTPTEGAAIEELPQGTVRVTVVYWRADEGRDRSASYSWEFDVV